MVDLITSRSRVLIIGGGSVGERKAMKVLQGCPNVTVVSRDFAEGLRKLQRRGKVRLVRMDVEDNCEELDRMAARADIVIVATSDTKTNGEVARMAKRTGALVEAVDNPSASDFNFPATAEVGDVRIAVSTGGRSPAVAKMLCERFRKEITRDDQLQLRLQQQMRSLASRSGKGLEARKTALYDVMKDGEIKGLLKRGRFGEAKRIAEEIVANA